MTRIINQPAFKAANNRAHIVQFKQQRNVLRCWAPCQVSERALKSGLQVYMTCYNQATGLSSEDSTPPASGQNGSLYFCTVNSEYEAQLLGPPAQLPLKSGCLLKQQQQQNFISILLLFRQPFYFAITIDSQQVAEITQRGSSYSLPSFP